MAETQNRDATQLRWQESTGFGIRVSGPEYRKWSTGKHCDEVAVVKNVKTVMYVSKRWHSSFNPRPAGVWLVTRPAGGGGAKGPWDLPNSGPISKFQTPFDSPRRELPIALDEQGKKIYLEVTGDVTGQVEVRIFDFSGLVTSASIMSMLSANKANETAWIVSLTCVTDMCHWHVSLTCVTDMCHWHVSLTLTSFPVLCDYNTGQGHLRSLGKKRPNPKKSRFRAVIHVFRKCSNFLKGRENDPKTFFEASKSVKKQSSENHG